MSQQWYCSGYLAATGVSRGDVGGPVRCGSETPQRVECRYQGILAMGRNLMSENTL